MKKITLYSALLFSMAMLITLFAVGERTERLPAGEHLSGIEIMGEQESVYTLKDENGSIIIEYMGTKTETEIRTAGLRSYDKDLLAKGIEAESYEQVLMLLEDFNS